MTDPSKLRRCRQVAGFRTVVSAAEKAGVNHKSIRYLEKPEKYPLYDADRPKSTSFQLLEKLATAYGCHIEDFLSEVPELVPTPA